MNGNRKDLTFVLNFQGKLDKTKYSQAGGRWLSSILEEITHESLRTLSAECSWVQDQPHIRITILPTMILFC